MTFSRTPQTPVNFLAYSSTNAAGGKVLRIQIGSGSVDLPEQDAKDFATYIGEKFN